MQRMRAVWSREACCEPPPIATRLFDVELMEFLAETDAAGR